MEHFQHAHARRSQQLRQRQHPDTQSDGHETLRRRGGGSSGGGGGGGSSGVTPVGSVVIPTDTPTGGVALQNSGDNTSGGAGGSSSQGVPSWLKLALIALIGAALLAVIIWYLRTWNQEPEGDG
jgi:hypothetical protein